MHILLLARHYPPEVSGGARRPYLMTRALRTLGHRVTVVTPFALNDHDSITVVNTSINRSTAQASKFDEAEPAPTARNALKNTLRQWLFWPDPDIRWAKDVVRAVKSQNIRPDWIFTTSPPESIHYAGAKLSQGIDCPWVAELRDTWIEFPHRGILERSTLRAKIERRIAKKYLSKCAAITAVSEAVMTEARKYVAQDTPECILTHFSDQPPSPYKFDNNKLNLVHTGGFSLSDRRRELKALLVELQSTLVNKSNTVLHIAGVLTPEETHLAQNSDISVILHGTVSLEISRALQAGADALILHTPANSHVLPGKYAEYMMTNRPILYLGVEIGYLWSTIQTASDPSQLA